MSDLSKPVISNQRFCHPGLGKLVHKHLHTRHQRPVADHSRLAFESLLPWLAENRQPLILDSFCGTGMSTALIAQRNPDARVIGVDKSSHRLKRHEPGATDNYRLLRADCGDFWRLALGAGWQFNRHYLLYPNPWPKSGQLQRRVHGTPEFATLLALGGIIELRSNWQVYVEEFGSALFMAGLTPCINLLREVEPMSLFERKYLQSRHQLWRCQCQLGQNRRP
jgi:tRNA (guanine-N7-)-methyltransferase